MAKLLYGVGIGLTRKHLTLEAIDVIKEADDVVVPGKMAYEVIKDIREPRVVEFPMGDSEEVVKNLAKEINEFDGEVAFCCIGDPVFYSTFHHLVREVRKLDPNLPVKIIPGISSISVALAKTETFITKSALIATQDFKDTDVVVVLKVKNPKEVERRLRNSGYNDFTLLEKLFMDGEKIYCEMPERSSYFSVMVARRVEEK